MNRVVAGRHRGTDLRVFTATKSHSDIGGNGMSAPTTTRGGCGIVAKKQKLGCSYARKQLNVDRIKMRVMMAI
jgi:hypothetical protein